MKTSLPRLLGLSSVLAASFLGATQTAHATLLTYWNFNNTSPAYNSGGGLLGSFNTSGAEAYTQSSNSAPGTLASNSGNSAVFIGSIDFSNIATITSPTINGKTPTGYTSQNATSGAAGYGSFLGYTVNAVGSDVAGDSLLLLNTAGNIRTKYITFSLSSLGYDTLSLSYATRLTNSVTSQQVWSFSSTLNGTYTTLTTLSPTANGTATLQTVDLSSLSGLALDNQSTFYLRMTYTSANTQGSQAIDNIQLTGVAAIPEPSTYALLGGAVALGLAFVIRRRRR
ncbi:MAG: PEP-CTERM sorting domain-containing protein [Opitutaceae bacterium]|jgi:hypothetical protein